MPFCPSCRDEFEDWVEICPDCNVDLVDELPSPTPKQPRYINEDLVTIAAFPYPGTAYIMSSKLEAAGIPSFVADARIVNINWMLYGAVGGVKLQVKESDAAEAIEILGLGNATNEGAISTGETCPKCGSEAIYYETFHARPMFIVWLLSYLALGSGSYGGFMLPFLKRKWKCRACGFQWKKRN
jgi:hypothetical protein